MALTNEREALQARIGYVFQDQKLLESALTHPSAPGADARKAAAGGYERLEFLGDRVLGLAVAELLLERFPKAPEGGLSKRHVALVRKEALLAVARRIELIDGMRHATGEGRAFVRQKETAAADGVEALLGAIFLDGGYDPAARFVRRWWDDMVETVAAPPKDPKTELQEWAQARSLPLPRYDMISSDGPDHQPTFVVTVAVEGRDRIEASGRSKRAAEQAAAADMLDAIQAEGRS